MKVADLVQANTGMGPIMRIESISGSNATLVWIDGSGNLQRSTVLQSTLLVKRSV